MALQHFGENGSGELFLDAEHLLVWPGNWEEVAADDGDICVFLPREVEELGEVSLATVKIGCEG